MRLLERFDHRTTPGVMADFKPTLVFGVPTIYVRLLDPAVLSDDQARAIGAAARLFVSGSAPLPAHVHDAFHARFGHTILERYGMSESLMITSNPYDGERRPGSVGPPLPGVSARIVGEDGDGARRRRGRRGRGSGRRISSPSIGGARTQPPRRSTTAGFARETSACDQPTATTRCAVAAET